MSISVEKFENVINETALHLCTNAIMSSLCLYSVCVLWRININNNNNNNNNNNCLKLSHALITHALITCADM